jgi:hypothetical protein
MYKMSHLISESKISALDVLVGDNPGDLKALRDELTDLDFQLKKLLDAGLPPDQFTFFQGLKKSSESALTIVEGRK